jgi:hypothetical protein
MNIKVKAKVKIHYGAHYYDTDSLAIVYEYKIRGFTNQYRTIYLENKSQLESYDEFMVRLVKRLETLSIDEVIKLIKEEVTKDAKRLIEKNSNKDKVDALLKDLNNIKFNFKLK